FLLPLSSPLAPSPVVLSTFTHPPLLPTLFPYTTLFRSNPTNHTKKYTVARKNDYLLTNPWGTSYQRVSQLSKYGNQVFQAQKSLKLGLLTFHYGKIGNDYGWIQDNRLKEYTPVAPSPSVKTVKYNQSFNQVLNTQMNLRSKPQAWVSGGGWRN